MDGRTLNNNENNEQLYGGQITGRKKFNVEALWNEATKFANPTTLEEDAEYSWNKLRRKIEEALKEILVSRIIRMSGKSSKILWIKKRNKTKWEEKKRAYLQNKSLKI